MREAGDRGPGDRGPEPPALRTLQAAFVRELSPAARAVARSGEAGREHALYLRYEAPHRNAVWQADHEQLPLLVAPPPLPRPRPPRPGLAEALA